jgi:hypothetical protein
MDALQRATTADQPEPGDLTNLEDVRGNGKVIQNNTITNWCNVGIHRQNNDGGSKVNASEFGNGVTAPRASFPFAALFADNGATATDTGTMNLVVGIAGNSAQQNTLGGAANAVV